MTSLYMPIWQWVVLSHFFTPHIWQRFWKNGRIMCFSLLWSVIHLLLVLAHCQKKNNIIKQMTWDIYKGIILWCMVAQCPFLPSSKQETCHRANIMDCSNCLARGSSGGHYRLTQDSSSTFFSKRYPVNRLLQ